MSGACGPLSNPTNCLNPCDDVFLCVNVERAQNEAGTIDEFVYTVTIQNCSKSILRNANVFVKLGGFVCADASITVAQGVIPSPAIDIETCGNGTANEDWNGISTGNIDSTLTSLIFGSLYIPPGSWQGWFRFTSDRAVTDSSRLSSTVMLKAGVLDSACQNPCRLEKCLEVDGDACLGQ